MSEDWQLRIAIPGLVLSVMMVAISLCAPPTKEPSLTERINALEARIRFLEERTGILPTPKKDASNEKQEAHGLPEDYHGVSGMGFGEPTRTKSTTGIGFGDTRKFINGREPPLPVDPVTGESALVKAMREQAEDYDKAEQRAKENAKRD